MLDKFSQISLIADYIRSRQQEIGEYNQDHNYDQNLNISGRRQTNVGVFRAYIIGYLRNNSKLHQEMTFLVRQLTPTERGLPLEIYVFSKDQAWANYEAIQADIGALFNVMPYSSGGLLRVVFVAMLAKVFTKRV